MKNKGILLINLGTPTAATSKAIRTYLFEFLRDRRVIDIPRLLRFLLVTLIILPFRPRRIRAAYQKIWTPEGSPLLVNSVKLQQALQRSLKDTFIIRLAMRYGQPSIKEQIAQIAHCEEILVAPLYPQYAASSTATALAEVFRCLEQGWNVPSIKTLPAFYQHPLFIDAWAEIISAAHREFPWDYLLFSYHGLPKRHLTKSGCSHAVTDCTSSPCPLNAPEAAHYCYRWQCYKTTEKIAERLNLAPGTYGVSFQSRLGRTPWIEPYTDLILPELHKRGIRKLAVVSPSFVSDCLETVEEIGVRLREQWYSYQQGAEFLRIECLNDHPVWTKALAQIIEEAW